MNQTYTHKYLESDKDLLAPDILDDVKDLLDGDFGDDRILKDVYRACQNGEVISNYERKYVRDLTKLYLKDKRMEWILLLCMVRVHMMPMQAIMMIIL